MSHESQRIENCARTGDLLEWAPRGMTGQHRPCQDYLARFHLTRQAGNLVISIST